MRTAKRVQAASLLLHFRRSYVQLKIFQEDEVHDVNTIGHSRGKVLGQVASATRARKPVAAALAIRPSAKKNALVLSEAAKDLVALKAEQSAQEEAFELVTQRLKEKYSE